jgi:protein-disulfide isomerase
MPKPSAGLAAIILSAFAVVLSGLALLFATGLLGAGRLGSPQFQSHTREYLLQNPEVLVEALQKFEQRQQAAESNELQTVIAEHSGEIFNDPAAPVLGNPDGDVTLVEFFDYNCPYCRKAAPQLQQALADDSGLKLALKEWPILGPGSEFAAKAALASQRQGKYEAFHKGLMGFTGAISESSTLTVAGQVGLDVERLKQDMNDPAISAAIERNRALANDLRIGGTPTFVVGNQIIRGLVDLQTLQQSIAGAREKPKGS